jgi:DNA-binding IscR family transcriptional regulator
VGDVLRAVEGTLAGPDAGRGRRGAPPDELDELWREVADAVSGVLDRTTFDELRRRVEARRSATHPMYHI